MTTRINTRIHQALNHISWGWELLYSCPLKALYPFYCFESSSCLLLLLLWPLGQYRTSFLLLSCTTVSLMRRGQSNCVIYFTDLGVLGLIQNNNKKKSKTKCKLLMSAYLDGLDDCQWKKKKKKLWWNHHSPKLQSNGTSSFSNNKHNRHINKQIHRKRKQRLDNCRVIAREGKTLPSSLQIPVAWARLCFTGPLHLTCVRTRLWH